MSVRFKVTTFALISAAFSSLIMVKVSAGDVRVSTYSDLSTEISAASEATEIILDGDINVPDDETIVIPSEKNITLELNGHTISGKSTASKGSTLIINNGTLTVKDNSDTLKDGSGSGKITFLAEHPDEKNSPTYSSDLMNNNGTFVLEGGLLENITDNVNAHAANTIDNNSVALNDTKLTINGGKISSKSSCGIRVYASRDVYNNDLTMNGGIVEGVYGIQLQTASGNIQPKSNIIIKDGEVKGTGIAFYVFDASTQTNEINISVTGGKFTAESSNGYATYLYGSFFDVAIDGGDFESNSYAFYYYDSLEAPKSESARGKVTINGGNFTSNGDQYAAFLYLPYSEIEINGGSFTGGKGALYHYGSFGASANNNTNVKITGGDFSAINSAATALYIYNDFSNVEISGGTFNGEYALYYYGYYDAGETHNKVTGGTFNGYNLLYNAYMANPDANYNSNLKIYGGNFSDDIYAYGYNGGWYFTTNTSFVDGGFFKDKESQYWPYYIKEGFWTTDKMSSAPDGFPYTIGHKITLSANYDGGNDNVIYTTANGSMNELYLPERDKHLFLNWNTEPDGSGNVVSSQDFVNKDTTLYAQWEEVIPGWKKVEIINDDMVKVFVDNETVFSALLSQDDYKLIEQGRNIAIQINIESIDDSEKTYISDKAKELELLVGDCFRIRIVKRIEYKNAIESEEEITDAKDNILFYIATPDSLKMFDRDDFRVLRYYDGQSDILETNHSDDGALLMFSTNKFSTFSILYKEKVPSIPSSGYQSPEQGVHASLFVTIVVVLGGVSLLCLKKGKNKATAPCIILPEPCSDISPRRRGRS